MDHPNSRKGRVKARYPTHARAPDANSNPNPKLGGNLLHSSSAVQGLLRFVCGFGAHPVVLQIQPGRKFTRSTKPES
eukprot:1358381-Amorphochlora_amoeboformis.AAC.1